MYISGLGFGIKGLGLISSFGHALLRENPATSKYLIPWSCGIAVYSGRAELVVPLLGFA